METASVPPQAEDVIERRVPAYRFGIVLLLLLATFIFLASGPSGDWVPPVAVVLQGATLLAALSAAGAARALLRVAVVVVLVALVSASTALFIGGNEVSAALFLLNLLFVGAAPVVIIHSLVRRRVIDLRTVLGAVCVYVLLGMMWSFTFAAVGTLDSEPFFAEQTRETVADYLYFSFTTLTTVGYGDLTAAHGLGRALAMLEALIGQLYLVTVIALLVSNLGSRARAARSESSLLRREPSSERQ
jgi:Ion channel